MAGSIRYPSQEGDGGNGDGDRDGDENKEGAGVARECPKSG